MPDLEGGYEERVLVLAPTGRDSTLICDVLQKNGLPCEPCRNLEDLSAKMTQGAGAAVVAEEALAGANAKNVIGFLNAQPAWSDFPLLIITRSGNEADQSSIRLMTMFGDRANIAIVERPIRVSTLVISVRSVLRARRRQYEVRDYLIDRKKSEEHLLQTQKLESLGVLAGGVAHDFNNLLTGILGNSTLAQDNLMHNLPVDGLLADVIDASERAADLTRQLLAYSGKGKFVIRKIDLSGLVGQISRLIQSSVPRTVTLQMDLAEHLPPIEGDSSQLQQIVMNLVINGAEAIGPDKAGEVRIRTGVERINGGHGYLIGGEQLMPGTYVFLEVQDTGIGMDEDTISRIFDPFFTTKFLGRGLGLAAASGIVRGHGGALRVHSVPGHGTTFRVLFPAARAAASADAAGTSKDLAGKGVILIIEDEGVVQKIARNALERYGYSVLVADNGQSGIDLFQKQAAGISLVLLDMTMPVMSGEETFRHLKQMRPDVKVVLSSGYNETEVFRHFSEKGLAGFIQKPYTASELAEKVQAVLYPQPLAGARGSVGG